MLFKQQFEKCYGVFWNGQYSVAGSIKSLIWTGVWFLFNILLNLQFIVGSQFLWVWKWQHFRGSFSLSRKIPCLFCLQQQVGYPYTIFKGNFSMNEFEPWQRIFCLRKGINFTKMRLSIVCLKASKQIEIVKPAVIPIVSY